MQQDLRQDDRMDIGQDRTASVAARQPVRLDIGMEASPQQRHGHPDSPSFSPQTAAPPRVLHTAGSRTESGESIIDISIVEAKLHELKDFVDVRSNTAFF